MSDQRVTVGMIGELFFPVGDHTTEKHNALESKLYDLNSKLKLSYCGRMIVYIHSETPVYDAGLVLFGEDDDMKKAFHNELVSAGLSVEKRKQKMFVDNWYDGSDPPHLMLTLKGAGFL